MGKVRNPQDVLKEVLDWTGGQPFLTQKLCKLIPVGDEELSVKQLVQSCIIKNWESQDEPEHLRTIRDRLLSDKQGAGQLLGLYQQILQQENIIADSSGEQMKLRLSGLVVKQEGKLKVYNRIYRRVFDKRWVNKALADFRPVFFHKPIRSWLASNCQENNQSSISGNFYYLLIKGNGNFAMGKHSESQGWDNKVNWEKSIAIKQGNNQWNQLRIVCNGKNVIGWINNQRVGKFEDKSYTSGQIGVISGRGEGDAVAVYFDDVVVKEKPE